MDLDDATLPIVTKTDTTAGVPMVPGATTEETLENFIDAVIQAKQYTTLDEESRAYVRAQLMGRVQDYMTATLIEKLTDEQVAEYNRLSAEEKDEEAQQYVAQCVPDMKSVAIDALTRFIDDYGVGPHSAVAED